MFASTVFAYVLMGAVVISTKSLAGALRPDGSNFLSFPSDHTAAAFTAATLLYKEYGFKTPLATTATFLLVAVTGFTRQLNNRHWLGDVLVGTTVSIMMIELACFLANLIFRKESDTHTCPES